MNCISDWMSGYGLRYEYDGAGRITYIRDYDDSVLYYGYDEAGNVVYMNDYHGNTTVYAYTDANQLSTITAPGGKVWSFAYNADGQVTRYDHPNGMDTRYWYDAQGRMYAVRHYDGSTYEDGWYYTFDSMGRITQMTDANNDYWRYYYDGRSRLTQARRHLNGGALRYQYDYAYDDGDNMLTKAVYDAVLDTTETTAFTYDVGNKLTAQSVGGVDTAFAYDVFGRMTSKAQGAYSATYGYRYDHKLRSVVSNFPSEGNVTYDYGADGKRRSRVDATGATQYKWDAGWNVINEEDLNGLLTRTYIGHTLAHVDGTDPSMGAYKYYCHDHLGSTRRVRDDDRDPVAGYEYTPYGEEYAFTGAPTTTNRRYAMLEWDGTSQMHFAPYRYYMPQSSIWNRRDPIRSTGSLYSYVGGNPASRVDPMGLTWNPASGNGWREPECGCGGIFKTKVSQNGGPNPRIDITFEPPEGSNCERIDYVQITRRRYRFITSILFGWAHPSYHWHLDTTDARWPYYSLEPEAGLEGTMDDSPNAGASGWQEFETCAVCAKGKDSRTIYGCLTWTASTDKDLNVTILAPMLINGSCPTNKVLRLLTFLPEFSQGPGM